MLHARLSSRVWINIVAIWTMAAVSLATQTYLNAKSFNQDIRWFDQLFRQLPLWYLWALFTPVVISIYNRYPLHLPSWKSNLLYIIAYGVITLLLFSQLRLAVLYYLLFQVDLYALSLSKYLSAFLSQLAWDITVYVLIIAVIFAERAYHNSREKENLNQELKTQLLQSQLETLKLQLSPHFLFNTLNTVNALIRTGRYSEAIQVNMRLGDLLRTTLSQQREGWITLQQELTLADLYLSIEQVRYGERLKIIKEVDDNVKFSLVPGFILQPLLENAIKHGISKRSTAQRIVIAAVPTNSILTLRVFNEGDFLEEPWAPAQKGIGLNNVFERLMKMYDNNAKFSIRNDYVNNGVEVVVNIPLQYDTAN